jgi:hypothetical protein
LTENIKNVKKYTAALLKAINEYYVEENAEESALNISYGKGISFKSQRRPQPWKTR